MMKISVALNSQNGNEVDLDEFEDSGDGEKAGERAEQIAGR